MPIVPVRIDGLFRVLPRGRRLPRRGRVRVAFGPALRFDPDTPYSAAAAAVEAAVRALD